MVRYTIKRLLWMIPVVVGVAVLIFTILYFTPGDPALIILGTSATQDELNSLRETMGLNRPYIIQLLDFLRQTFIHFDFGVSYFTSKSITGEILSRLPHTVTIALGSMIISCLVGIPLGITAAVNQNKFSDRFCMLIALIGVSMPQFWLGLLLVMLLSLKLNLLPPSGVGGIQYYIIPIIATSFGGIAAKARLTRSSMLEVIRSDYVVTARAKGVTKRDAIYKHALPNALIPVITQVGTSFGRMLGGTVVIETVFTIPGIGSYMITAINNRDYPVVRGCVVFLAIAFSFVMLLVDLLYAYVDPRIKAQYEGKGRKK
jgi:peptide/nickel transport system permease protein